MDFSKLGQNEKLAVYGSGAVIIGGLVGLGAAGLGLVAVLAAIGMLAVVFLPQMSPSTQLPGSKGTLMLALGAVAGVILVLGFLTVLGSLAGLLQFAAVSTIFYIAAVAGGVLMAWAGWQEFQAEGGKFQFGNSTASSAAAPPAASAERDVERPAYEAPANTVDRADAPIDRDPEDRPTA